MMQNKLPDTNWPSPAQAIKQKCLHYKQHSDTIQNNMYEVQEGDGETYNFDARTDRHTHTQKDVHIEVV